MPCCLDLCGRGVVALVASIYALVFLPQGVSAIVERMPPMVRYKRPGASAHAGQRTQENPEARKASLS